MVIADIARKVRYALIKSRTTLSGVRAGLFKVHAHGSGYDFDQLSEYHEGGDFRRIDWKSSARTNNLLLREYKDEQNRTIHVMVDVSPSLQYGTGELLVSDIAAELVQAFKIISCQAQDTFIEHQVNPLLSSWKEIFEQFALHYRRRALLIIISDSIIDEHCVADYESALRILSRQHEIIMVRVRDAREDLLFTLSDPFICKDSETAQKFNFTAQTTSMCEQLKKWRTEQMIFFRKCNIPLLDCYAGVLSNGEDHVDALVKFLRKNV